MDKKQLLALIKSRANQMNVSVTALAQFVVDCLVDKKTIDSSMVDGVISKYRCAYNNPLSPKNIRAAKSDRGMTKVLNLIDRFKF